MQGINLKYWRAQRFTASSIFRNSVKHRFYTNGKCSNTSSFSIWSTFKKCRNQAVISQSQEPRGCTRLSPHVQHFQTLPRALALLWAPVGKGTLQHRGLEQLWLLEGLEGLGLHSLAKGSSGHPSAVCNHLSSQGYGAGTARLRRMQQEETLTVCTQNSDWIEWKNSSPKEQSTPRTEFLRGLESPCLKSLKIQLKKKILSNLVQ